METKHLRKYAPEARREFIEAVVNKAAVYGLLPDETLPMQEEGDVVIIGDRPFPRTVAKQRKELEARIRKDGFQQFIEAVAYTWFNRFVAIRYMELHGYLDHGYRVFSHPEGNSTPELLESAERIELPGLNRDEVVDLKLDGGKDEQLYQMLLLAQCNALHKAMPFLFESIKDGTELLLPDNLLHTDSLVRTLVNNIPKEQWENVEIIGWLYQFYISEKKDEVIGKVVKSEDIPAATQLFTPNWIVKYLVQNSLGRQWVATYPDSPLKQQMEFYIEPADQTPEVQKQLDGITPESLNPEELTLLDPACGSGHILVEAYDLFQIIYEERGYRARDIPKLILTKNLFGLEIDDRAAQLAAFSLMMKARSDDRGIFGRDVQPNVLAIQESKGLDAREITEALNEPILKEKLPPSGELFEEIAEEKSPLFSKKNLGVKGDISHSDVVQFIELFEDAKSLGSLLRVPSELSPKIGAILQRSQEVSQKGEMFSRVSADRLLPLLRQATLLTNSFDAVVANPPYMGNRGMNQCLRDFAKRNYPITRQDLYSMFIERGLAFTKSNGSMGMVTMLSWMFLSSFQEMREHLLARNTFLTMAHLGPRAFGEISGEVVQSTAFIFVKTICHRYRPTFFRLIDGQEGDKKAALSLRKNRFAQVQQSQLEGIPGSPLAYWVSAAMLDAFQNPKLGTLTIGEGKNITADNDKFLRRWWEVPTSSIGRGKKWIVYAKGGEFRKWAGNLDHVSNWSPEARKFYRDNSSSRIIDSDYWYLRGVTWTVICSTGAGFRLLPEDTTFDTKGLSLFFREDKHINAMLGLLNSIVGEKCISVINPSMCINTIDVKAVPIPESIPECDDVVEQLISIATKDWDSQETSLGFAKNPLVTTTTCRAGYDRWTEDCQSRRGNLIQLETENNRRWLNAFCLLGEFDEVPDEENITLVFPTFATESQNLVSFAIGCMMGRYSLDEPGLVYAHSGNEDFDSNRHTKLPADEDGIVPITDTAWFPDDTAHRFEQFIKTAWPEEHLEENLTFVAESLGQKKGETSRECIRRYLATGFYKHHLQMYKKRPIYWLFSSGKQRAFQCLVYLHRYNAGTLSRMRTEYVVKLQGKINTRIEQLEDNIPDAESTSHRKELERERDKLLKQREELQTFDEKLRHAADLRIELDLDDGVKVNYGKFGDLLAEVKSITGKKPEVMA